MYVSGGDGAIGIFERKDPGTYEQIGEGATAEGARTSLFVPEMGKLHLAVPNYGPSKQKFESTRLHTAGNDVFCPLDLWSNRGYSKQLSL
jgi:hypothetical protein